MATRKYMHPLTGKILRVSEWAVELENEWDKMPDTRKLCPHWDSRNIDGPKEKRHSKSRYNYSMIDHMAGLFCEISLVSLRSLQRKRTRDKDANVINYEGSLDYDEYYVKKFIGIKEILELGRECALREFNHYLCQQVNREYNMVTGKLFYSDCKIAEWCEIGHYSDEWYEKCDKRKNYECKSWMFFEHLNPYISEHLTPIRSRLQEKQVTGYYI